MTPNSVRYSLPERLVSFTATLSRACKRWPPLPRRRRRRPSEVASLEMPPHLRPNWPLPMPSWRSTEPVILILRKRRWSPPILPPRPPSPTLLSSLESSSRALPPLTIQPTRATFGTQTAPTTQSNALRDVLKPSLNPFSHVLKLFYLNPIQVIQMPQYDQTKHIPSPFRINRKMKILNFGIFFTRCCEFPYSSYSNSNRSQEVVFEQLHYEIRSPHRFQMYPTFSRLGITIGRQQFQMFWENVQCGVQTPITSGSPDTCFFETFPGI